MSKERISAGLGEAAPVFAALGDQTRLSLVFRMGAGDPLSISALASGTEMTRQAITKHLQVLEAVGLVASRRQGRERLWVLEAERVREAQRWLDMIGSQWDAALGRLKASLEQQEK